MRKTDIIEHVVLTTDLPKDAVEDVIDSLVADIKKSLKRGEVFRLAGIGRFYAKPRKARIGRNPATGEPVTIPARTAVLFRASSELRKYLG